MRRPTGDCRRHIRLLREENLYGAGSRLREACRSHIRESSGPTHKRTEGRAPVWGSEFTIEAATLQEGVIVVLRPLFAAALVVRRRYLIVAPRPFPAAPLVTCRRRCLLVVPRPMPAAPRIYLIVVYRPLPAAPLAVRCMYMAVVPGPMPAAEASRCGQRRFK
jgi:hypothetical protein